MPFDAVFLTALAQELRTRAVGCRVDRVHQPARDEVILQLRGREGQSRLLLCAGPNHPRAQFTDAAYESPAQPPMFCMLLRKHLVGGRIADTPGFGDISIERFEPVYKEELFSCFREFAPCFGKCRFSGCQHDKEPGCAVKQAVQDGEIAASRYESYLSMLYDVKDIKEWEINDRQG